MSLRYDVRVVGARVNTRAEMDYAFQLEAGREMKAVLRETVVPAWRALARPSRQTGYYEDTIIPDVHASERSVIGTVIAQAPYAEFLEKGRKDWMGQPGQVAVFANRRFRRGRSFTSKTSSSIDPSHEHGTVFVKTRTRKAPRGVLLRGFEPKLWRQEAFETTLPVARARMRLAGRRMRNDLVARMNIERI